RRLEHHSSPGQLRAHRRRDAPPRRSRLLHAQPHGPALAREGETAKAQRRKGAIGVRRSLRARLRSRPPRISRNTRSEEWSEPPLSSRLCAFAVLPARGLDQASAMRNGAGSAVAARRRTSPTPSTASVETGSFLDAGA